MTILDVIKYTLAFIASVCGVSFISLAYLDARRMKPSTLADDEDEDDCEPFHYAEPNAKWGR